MAAGARETQRLLDSMTTPFLSSKKKPGWTGGGGTLKLRRPAGPRKPRSSRCAPSVPSLTSTIILESLADLQQQGGEQGEAAEVPAAPPPPALSPRSPPRPGIHHTKGIELPVTTGPPAVPILSARTPWWNNSVTRSGLEDVALDTTGVENDFHSPELTWPDSPSSSHSQQRAQPATRVQVAKLLKNPQPHVRVGLASTGPQNFGRLRRELTDKAEPRPHSSPSAPAVPPEELPAQEEVTRQTTAQRLASGGPLGQGDVAGTLGEESYLGSEQLREELAEELASRYRNGLASLKEHQAAWRRQHDAFVRKKQLAALASSRMRAAAAGSGAGHTGSAPSDVSPPASAAATESAGPSMPSSPGGPADPPGSARSMRGGRDRLRDLVTAATRNTVTLADASTVASERCSTGTPPEGTPPPESPTASATPPAEGQTEGRRHSRSFGLDRDSPARAPPLHSATTDIDSTLGRITERRSIGSGVDRADLPGADESAGFASPEHYSPRTQRRTIIGIGNSSSGHHRASADYGIGLGSPVAGRPNLAHATSFSVGKVAEPKDTNFNSAVTMARKHKLPLEEVRRRQHEFLSCALNEDGELPQTEFREMIRKYCGIEPGGEIPPHLLRQHDRTGAGITFEDFLLWTVVTAWLPERLVSDPEERRLRELARENKLCITDIERIKSTFDKFDTDRNQVIDEKEFRHLVLTLMDVKNPSDISAKRLHRYWYEVDTDRSGTISFEEFLRWYLNLFDF